MRNLVDILKLVAQALWLGLLVVLLVAASIVVMVVAEVQITAFKYELICVNVPSSPECKQYRRWVRE